MVLFNIHTLNETHNKPGAGVNILFLFKGNKATLLFPLPNNLILRMLARENCGKTTQLHYRANEFFNTERE